MLLHFSSEARLAIANAGEQSPHLLQANPTFPTFIDASALHLLPLHLTASVKPSTPFGFLFFPSDEPDPPLFVTFLFFSYLEFPHKEEKIAKPYSAFNSSFYWRLRPLRASSFLLFSFSHRCHKPSRHGLFHLSTMTP